MMPIAEFAGRRGWGYDGVDLFAPSHLYGTPDDLRRFVDRAHRARSRRHSGRRLQSRRAGRELPWRICAGATSATRYKNEWGEALNFDDDAAAVRELMIANAEYWIDEFHLDGLRLDATQQIFDASADHLLAEMSRRTRAAARGRSILLIAENEPQDVRVIAVCRRGRVWLRCNVERRLPPCRRGCVDWPPRGVLHGLRRLAARICLARQVGISLPGAEILVAARAARDADRRFRPLLASSHFSRITIRSRTRRPGAATASTTCSSPGAYRALTALWLLSPGTPMFFQGQEFAASSPFLYFADHGGTLGAAVRAGRAKFMSQFRSASTRSLVDVLADPNDEATFLAMQAAARRTRAAYRGRRAASRSAPPAA